MAVGNTFGATALSSYGGFWIAYGLLQTPTWNVLGADGPYEGETGSVMGFFLTGWWIFTTLLLICTLRSTLAFFSLFFFLDICFLLLACENYAHDLGNHGAQIALQKAAGFFGFLAAFMAWYNALAGLQDSRYVAYYPQPVFLIGANMSTATPSSKFPSSTSPGLTWAEPTATTSMRRTWPRYKALLICISRVTT
jgi:succinate-acetate transporter protein